MRSRTVTLAAILVASLSALAVGQIISVDRCIDQSKRDFGGYMAEHIQSEMDAESLFAIYIRDELAMCRWRDEVVRVHQEEAKAKRAAEAKEARAAYNKAKGLD
ncbi:MAG: hypothetical protein DHS20C03_02670 [Minwuia thermotolerans]|nr:MAG: hypothetical protein DHS20C03_02670 [Minwuia thermotolerans]